MKNFPTTVDWKDDDGKFIYKWKHQANKRNF